MTAAHANLHIEAVNELKALHWSSWANGATVPEIVGALAVRGVAADPIDVEATLWSVPSTLADVHPDWVRGGQAVWTPAEMTR